MKLFKKFFYEPGVRRSVELLLPARVTRSDGRRTDACGQHPDIYRLDTLVRFVILFTNCRKRIKRHRVVPGACFVLLCLAAFWSPGLHAQSVRTEISLNKNWQTVADDQNKNAFDGFEQSSYSDKDWMTVDVPHNWDEYEGYRRMLHGNRHGHAWYRKMFRADGAASGKRYFLFFEGVGSYATVWLNGKQVGYHAGGRTTFTLDVTDAIKLNQQNLLAVRADHPANIRDLPWVCGGCSDERGFSEGSQPMGIFRPVHLIMTNDVRVQPFGVHIWNDSTITTKSARLYFEAEIKNYGNSSRQITIVNRLLDHEKNTVTQVSTEKTFSPGETIVVKQEPAPVKNARLWSLEEPYLYTLVTEIKQDGKTVDRVSTPYGIRWISWPVNKSSRQFLLNGKPVFINGIAEYEHLLGSSHAFTGEEIRSRVMQIRAAGFNAFRDAHHPHNLRYQNYWDSLGVLWWTQMGAHIWFDSPEFRNNFKTLLRDWVKERRNSPSLVLWGLQNESKLPADFAKECTQIIRDLDPTASSQRLVTTCNGGEGTDWDVPQNWTGTYGGDPATYANDLKKQVLVGEYGAWRTLDLHSEDASYKSRVYSEERMTQLMETKVRLAESVKDSVAGHFMWLYTSHDNPGRVQGGEGFRELDRVGPVNYKGLLTPWEEPLDVYYMYRSNYAPKTNQPMVYIDSHTWPSRWTSPGKKNNIVVYSNCDEVELFNDVNDHSLGRKQNGSIGTHFQWDSVDIRYNVLYAVGYVNGKPVGKDYIVVNHLPQAPHFSAFFKNAKSLTQSAADYKYLYRVNCGGGDFVDENGKRWSADREKTDRNHWGSVSWTNDFPEMPPFFASQQRTFDPVSGTKDWKLFQTFRFGREKLKYYFPVQDGEYLIELYFIEPWLGTGGGMDCTVWRLFDVAINDRVVLKDLDIWKEAGHDGALKKTVKAKITGGELVISFPHVASGQAVISGIAIATADKTLNPAGPPEPIFKLVTNPNERWTIKDWLDLGDQQFASAKTTFSALPPEVFGAQWLQARQANSFMPLFEMNEDVDLFIGIDSASTDSAILTGFANTDFFVRNDAGAVYAVYKKRCSKGERINLAGQSLTGKQTFLVMAQPASNMQPAYDLKPSHTYKAVDANWYGPGAEKGVVDGKERLIFKKASPDNRLDWKFSVGVADIYSFTVSYHNAHDKNISGKLQLFAADGTLMKEEDVVFTPTRQGKSNYITTNTGTMINAGNYILRITSATAEEMSFNALDVQ